MLNLHINTTLLLIISINYYNYDDDTNFLVLTIIIDLHICFVFIKNMFKTYFSDEFLEKTVSTFFLVQCFLVDNSLKPEFGVVVPLYSTIALFFEEQYDDLKHSKHCLKHSKHFLTWQVYLTQDSLLQMHGRMTPVLMKICLCHVGPESNPGGKNVLQSNDSIIFSLFLDLMTDINATFS